MDNGQMTVVDALKITAANLEGITIPVGISDTVGVTIKGCIQNIKMCVEALEAAKTQAAGAGDGAEKEEGSGDGREDDAE